MTNDLNDIVRKRNAKLTQKPSRRRAAKVTTSQLSAALGVAPRYVIDAITRSMAIGRSDR